MRPWLGLDLLLLRVVRWLEFLWVRPRVLPEDLAETGIDPKRPVCYVLERNSLADLLVLEQVCEKAGFPRPLELLTAGPVREGRSVFSMRQMRGFIFRQPHVRPSERLERLVKGAVEDDAFDIQLVPVSIYWGRAPDKERSSFKLLFSEDWAVAGRFRKFLTVLFQGRSTLVQFSTPISLREVTGEELGLDRTIRKIFRVLRVHYRQRRVATLGPDLSHRRTVVSRVLLTARVQHAIDDETRQKNISRKKAVAKARKYAFEIAADYSNPVVQIFYRMLTRLWTRLYDGVEVNYIDQLTDITQGNEVVYVPCHRSHIDYLLLSYVVYKHGFALPHIAAGINLNFPVVGAILRRGGAFFIRRSFRSNRLYTAVMREYLSAIMAKGFPLEYFIEGGRSRTGRLLKPKPGMLSMTIRSYLRNPQLPVVFMPVYFGYEKLFEGDTFISELSGKTKEKESIRALFRALPELRSEFGKVHVNFGEPLSLPDLLDEIAEGWRDEHYAEGERPEWLNGAVDRLAYDIQVRINQAAAANPVNLLGMALLAAPKQAMLESAMTAQLEVYRDLLTAAPFSPLVTVTKFSGREMIAYGEKLGVIERKKHELGDVIHMSEKSAVLMTYFRNNVLHLFALPSLIACCYLNESTVDEDEILRLIRIVYPYVRAELFLPWGGDDVDEAIRGMIGVLEKANLLRRTQKDRLERPEPGSGEALTLSLLAQPTLQAIERYYMAVAILFQSGSGRLTQRELEAKCHLMAQRLSLLYELNSPEFFDKTLFKNFIDLLKRHGVVDVADDGRLTFDESVERVVADAQRVLSEPVWHTILQVTHG